MFKIETGSVSGPAVVHAPRMCRVCGWRLPDEITGLVMPIGAPGACPQCVENQQARIDRREPQAMSTFAAIHECLTQFTASRAHRGTR